MKIPINKDYILTSDARQIVLNRFKTRETGDNIGEEFLDPIGYYSGVEGALKGLLELEIKASNATTISELRADIIKIKEDIDRCLQT